jgi:hypothetical protein
MTQSKDESKMNIPRAISRDFSVREFGDPKQQVVKPGDVEQSVIRPNQSDIDEKVHRREMFGALLPASGKALAGFLRDLQTGIASAVEDLKRR